MAAKAKKSKPPEFVKDYGVLEGHQYLPREIAAFAYDAGFRLRRLVLAVQIALAESEGYAEAKHYYDDADGNHVAVDRGMWQIHSYWHSEIKDKCAYDPACAAHAIFKISKGGRSWGQWASFTGSSYKLFRVKAVRGVINFYWARFHKRIPYFEKLT